MSKYYLPEGLPAPVPENDDLSKPYWEGLKAEKLMVQKCNGCGQHQFGPEWICHNCNSFDLDWVEVQGKGKIYSWERAWHPVHPALREACPYVVVLVEFPEADGIRMLGNRVGDAMQPIEIGARVEPVFEDHEEAQVPFTLVHWRQV